MVHCLVVGVMFGVASSVHVFTLSFAFSFHLLYDLLHHFCLLLCLNFLQHLENMSLMYQ